MNKLDLSLAISQYDHVADLVHDRISPEGITLTCSELPIEEIFFRFTLYREWDVSEMSLGKYASLISHGDTSLTAIPIFPSRIFRHSSIYVRADGPVKRPEDLDGRRIGVPEWAQTAAVYARGLLHHQYGLDLTSIDWFQAGVNQPGRIEKVSLNLPPGIRLTRAGEKTLNDMLLTGEIDAIISAHPPACFKENDPRVRRLFENPMDVESDYFRQTGIFPIMHVIAIQREIVTRHPWVAGNLLTAFEEAKRRSIARALEITASRFPIPWSYEHARRAQTLFGTDYWPYGLDANRKTLDAFLQYATEQGVCHRRLQPEELFPAQVSHGYKI